MKILVIGDTHYFSGRQKAIKLAENSILKIIKKQKFDRIVFLGDLFDKKPTAQERTLLAEFLFKLRKHAPKFDFIIGNGKHTFEGDSIHEKDWMILCDNFKQHKELKIDKFIFGHYEVAGTRYIKGHLSDSTHKIDPKVIYILGHIHQPTCSFKNVNYVGSVYKVTSAEIGDTKRIAIITDDKLKFYPIKSRPMYEIELNGLKGKLQCKQQKFLKELEENSEIDLKIKVITDTQTLPSIHKSIKKIKAKFNIEYYRQEIALLDVKVDIPDNLDQAELGKVYCKKKNIAYKLIEKELDNNG